MTKSDRFSGSNFVITDADRAFFTLRNMTTLLTNNATGISFFIDENSYFLAFGEVLFYAHLHDFRKIWIEFFGHIHKENILVCMFKFFVIHSVKCKKSQRIIKMNFRLSFSLEIDFRNIICITKKKIYGIHWKRT